MILSFQETFVPAVVAGTKPHSIRAGSRWRVGMRIQFYKNARQKSMAKIRADGVALAVQQFTVGRDGNYCWIVKVDGRRLVQAEGDELARRDGFRKVEELIEFLANAHGLPFEGQLIHWTDLRY